MLFPTSLLLALLSATPTFGATDCDKKLDSIFSAMVSDASVANGLVSQPIPDECTEVKGSLLGQNGGSAEYKLNYNSFCSSNRFLETHIVSYSNVKEIAVDPTTMTENMGSFISSILTNSTEPHNCNSGLSYFDNGENGWNLWVEEVNSLGGTCTSPDRFLSDVNLWYAFYNVLDERKTSFCVTIEGDAGWRGLIRGLYSNETRFDSIADIPCHVVNPGFSTWNNCFDEPQV